MFSLQQFQQPDYLIFCQFLKTIIMITFTTMLKIYKSCEHTAMLKIYKSCQHSFIFAIDREQVYLIKEQLLHNLCYKYKKSLQIRQQIMLETVLRKSEIKDIGQIMSIYDDAKIFLKQSNIDQWQDNYPNLDIIQSDIQNGNSYVIQNHGKLIGIFVLDANKDLIYDNLYDGQWINKNLDYISLYRISVIGSQKNKGIGSKILRQAQLLCLEQGFKSIRVYTKQQNFITQRLLEKNLFLKCGKLNNLKGNQWIAYQKIIN